MTPQTRQRLDETIAAVCPIHGTSGDPPRIDYKPEATAQQQAAAQAALSAFDWSQAAHDAWLEDQQPQRKAIRQAAAQAIADNDAFLALGSPNNAAVLAQVRALTRQMNHVIRRLIQV